MLSFTFQFQSKPFTTYPTNHQHIATIVLPSSNKRERTRTRSVCFLVRLVFDFCCSSLFLSLSIIFFDFSFLLTPESLTCQSPHFPTFLSSRCWTNSFSLFCFRSFSVHLNSAAFVLFSSVVIVVLPTHRLFCCHFSRLIILPSLFPSVFSSYPPPLSFFFLLILPTGMPAPVRR